MRILKKRQHKEEVCRCVLNYGCHSNCISMKKFLFGTRKSAVNLLCVFVCAGWIMSLSFIVIEFLLCANSRTSAIFCCWFLKMKRINTINFFYKYEQFFFDWFFFTSHPVETLFVHCLANTDGEKNDTLELAITASVYSMGTKLWHSSQSIGADPSSYHDFSSSAFIPLFQFDGYFRKWPSFWCKQKKSPNECGKESYESELRKSNESKNNHEDHQKQNAIVW